MDSEEGLNRSSNSGRRSRRERRQNSMRSSQHSLRSFKDSASLQANSFLDTSHNQPLNLPPNLPKGARRPRKQSIDLSEDKREIEVTPTQKMGSIRSSSALGQVSGSNRPSATSRAQIMNSDLQVVQSDQKPTRDVGLAEGDLPHQRLDTEIIQPYRQDEDTGDITLRATLDKHFSDVSMHALKKQFGASGEQNRQYQQHISSSRNEESRLNSGTINQSTQSAGPDLPFKEGNRDLSSDNNQTTFDNRGPLTGEIHCQRSVPGSKSSASQSAMVNQVIGSEAKEVVEFQGSRITDFLKFEAPKKAPAGGDLGQTSSGVESGGLGGSGSNQEMYGSIQSMNIRNPSRGSTQQVPLNFGQRQRIQLLPQFSQLSSSQDLDTQVMPTPRDNPIRPSEQSLSLLPSLPRTLGSTREEMKQMSPDFKQPRPEAIEEYGTRVELSPSSQQVSPQVAETFQISIRQCQDGEASGDDSELVENEHRPSGKVIPKNLNLASLRREEAQQLPPMSAPDREQLSHFKGLQAGRGGPSTQRTEQQTFRSSFQSSQATFAPGVTRLQTERQSETEKTATGSKKQEDATQKYMKIFQGLLEQGIANQRQSVSCYKKFIRTYEARTTSSNVDPSSEVELPDEVKAILIDEATTKSFKELCQKLVNQQDFINSILASVQTQNDALYEELQAQAKEISGHQQLIQQLYESQVQEQKLSEQIHEAQIKDLQASQNKNFDEMMKCQKEKAAKKLREREEDMKGKIRSLEEQVTQLKQCLNCKKLGLELDNLKDSSSKMEASWKSSKELVAKLKAQAATLKADNEQLSQIVKLAEIKKENQQSFQAKYEKLQGDNETMKQKLKELDEYVKTLTQEGQNALDIFKLNLGEQMKENDDLKLQLQEQIKENLQIEAKGKAEVETQLRSTEKERRKIKELETMLLEQESQMQEKVYKMNQLQAQKEQEMDAAIETAKEEAMKTVDEMKGNLAKWREEAHQFKDMHAKLQDNYQKQVTTTIEHKKEAEQALHQVRLLQEAEIGYKKKIGSMQDEVQQSKAAMQQVKDQLEGLEGVDLALLLTKDNHLSAQTQKISRQKQSQMSAMSGLMRGSLPEQAEFFVHSTSSVHSFAQAISQARVIDKCVKQDQAQKKEIKQLKENLEDIQTKFTQISISIQKIHEEKAALEKLILEILGFGEQCDQQFDALQERMAALETMREKERAMPDPYPDPQLVADKAELKALQSIVHEQEVTIGLLKNNDEAVREAEISKIMVEQHLDESKNEIESLKGTFIECNLIVQNIIKNIKEADHVLKAQSQRGDKTGSGGLYETREQQVNFEFDSQFKKAFMANLHIIDEWTHDQGLTMHQMIKDRDRVLQLNLQMNELAKSNSLLKIENDKQANINASLRNQIQFGPPSPAARQSSGSLPPAKGQPQLHPTQLTITEMKSNSKSSQKGGTVLQSLLHKVQNLKEDPARDEEANPATGHCPLRLPPERAGERASSEASPKQYLEIDVASLANNDEGRQRSLHGSLLDSAAVVDSLKGGNNSYFDLRGSFEFVNPPRHQSLQYPEASYQRPATSTKPGESYANGEPSMPLLNSPDPNHVVYTEQNAFSSFEHGDRRQDLRKSVSYLEERQGRNQDFSIEQQPTTYQRQSLPDQKRPTVHYEDEGTAIDQNWILKQKERISNLKKSSRKRAYIGSGSKDGRTNSSKTTRIMHRSKTSLENRPRQMPENPRPVQQAPKTSRGPKFEQPDRQHRRSLPEEAKFYQPHMHSSLQQEDFGQGLRPSRISRPHSTLDHHRESHFGLQPQPLHYHQESLVNNYYPEHVASQPPRTAYLQHQHLEPTFPPEANSSFYSARLPHQDSELPMESAESMKQGKIDQINSLLENQQYLLGLTDQPGESEQFQESYRQRPDNYRNNRWHANQSAIQEEYDAYNGGADEDQHFGENPEGIQTYRESQSFTEDQQTYEERQQPLPTHRRGQSGLLTPPIFQGPPAQVQYAAQHPMVHQPSGYSSLQPSIHPSVNTTHHPSAHTSYQPSVENSSQPKMSGHPEHLQRRQQMVVSAFPANPDASNGDGCYEASDWRHPQPGVWANQNPLGTQQDQRSIYNEYYVNQ